MKKIFVLLILNGLVVNTFAQDNEKFLKRFSELAPKTVGLKEFPTVNGRRYNGDCSGFIAFLFHFVGLDLIRLYGIGIGGVESIWNGMKELNFVIDTTDLQVGDMLFFDNTYDKNRNLLWDDELSHIAVVESIDENDTVTYLHYGSKGVVRAKMNLKHPDVYSKVIDGKNVRFNDLLRASSKRGVNPKYLSGALFRGVARLNVKSRM